MVRDQGCPGKRREDRRHKIAGSEINSHHCSTHTNGWLKLLHGLLLERNRKAEFVRDGSPKENCPELLSQLQGSIVSGALLKFLYKWMRQAINARYSQERKRSPPYPLDHE
ncbi:MAG TPA: hypothetical protein DEA96_14390 [Leptospiraceae bacterium]|nr:hypothetical protein [Spirochaetaceae bacterium]HBS06153.1 hypothetical protein [Leptospiraceae bacterium]